ncbi:MAG: hypothetical protein JWM41_3655 [Gemmatimonadetes bacterium]|nr:hypothetical protein [Gemmatimonadota bacterium]
MSAPESSSALRSGEESAQFTRWPGLLSLSLAIVLGPVVALVNQQAIYAADMWVCGRGFRAALHIVPALCLIVVAGAAVGAYRNWQAVGRGVEDEQATIATRTRFLALLGMSISVFSSLVILAQWLAIFVFAPCQRA